MPASRRDRTDDGSLLADPIKNLRLEHIAEVEVDTRFTRSGWHIGCHPTSRSGSQKPQRAQGCSQAPARVMLASDDMRESNNCSRCSSPPWRWPPPRAASARRIRCSWRSAARSSRSCRARRVHRPPELALALFVAPVLLDAAFDASPRDLKDNWAPVTGLVVFAVGLTTAAVAVVARALLPAMPWAPAIALGAVVAPPDAAAATAVLRQLRPPHRILTILEGESLLNDASALLIYRLAVGAVAAQRFSSGAVAPTFLLAVAGSVVVGPALGWLAAACWIACEHVPTAIILQFVTTFGVWILAEHLGLSGVLTMVCYAITVARTAPERTPARIAHSVLRGVGDGRLRAEHPGVHLHRPADPADSRRASTRPTAAATSPSPAPSW